MTDFLVGEALDAVPRTPGGPCPWPVDLSCCDLTDVDALACERAVAIATDVLWAATGRRFGECAVTTRPCRRDEYMNFSGPWWDGSVSGSSWPNPALVGGVWMNIACGICGSTCSCKMISEVVLAAPVSKVLEVTIDGEVLPPTAYRVDDGRLLVRQDGQLWPLCQDLSRPAGEVGTWTVRATYGEPVPQLGMAALGELACEFIKACAGSDCRLPRRMQSLARQGVSMTFADPKVLDDVGLIGLDICDLFIRTYNPERLKSRAQVYAIDAPRPRVTG